MDTHRFLQNSAAEFTEQFQPIFFRLTDNERVSEFEAFIQSDSTILVIDEITGQLKELIKSLNPTKKLTEADYNTAIEEHLKGTDLSRYGVWVYYSWNKTLVHLLDEEEFIEVRTNRNRYKITNEEQSELRKKRIGVIGLSVGQSIALTLAMERTCGELRLADFDTVELSNLNRLRAGVRSLGTKKTIVAAREIAEIDPFIKVKLFSEGITSENIDDFFSKDGKLDVLVEVCDGLDIKIQSRFKARELGIPVVMDTNDRGLIDIERFDLERTRPILHGLAEGLNPDTIKDLTNEQKIPYILRMVGSDQLSTRLKASMMEVEQSINTWPQLASSVVLGGAVTTDVCRRILLNELSDSGRYYIDLDELISDREPEKADLSKAYSNPHTPLTGDEMGSIVGGYFHLHKESGARLEKSVLSNIVDAAIVAPSAGNNQPWYFFHRNNTLFLFHERHRSHSWGDFFEMGAHISLGAAIENIHLQSLKSGLDSDIKLFPLENHPQLVAAITFRPVERGGYDKILPLSEGIFLRNTNRKLGPRQALPLDFYTQMEYFVSAFPGVKMLYTDKPEHLEELGDIIGSADRIRLLHKPGHEEFYGEVRWNKKHSEEKRDGIELEAVDLKASEVAGFGLAKDWRAMELLAKWDKGNVFKKLSVKAVESASAIVLFSIPRFTHEDLILAGRAIERAWIFANMQGVSVHPMASTAFFYNRLVHGGKNGLADFAVRELEASRKRFREIFPLKNDDNDVFLLKLAVADDLGIKSLRREKGELFHES